MPAPIYRIFNGEVGTFIIRFAHGETQKQIESALECFAFPRGHSVLLMEDGTTDDENRLTDQWEDLRPLRKRSLALVR